MKRFLDLIGVIAIVGFLMIVSEGCGKIEQTLGPTEHQVQSVSTTSVKEFHDSMYENTMLIVIPGTGKKKELRDPWISDVIISILSEKTRIRLFTEGSVLIDDIEIASMIVAIASMGATDASGGVILYDSWTCIKCQYADVPYCTACPRCCEKDKDHGIVPYIDF